MTRSKLGNIWIFSALLFFVSCDRCKVFDLYLEINPQGWVATDTIDFEIAITKIDCI